MAARVAQRSATAAAAAATRVASAPTPAVAAARRSMGGHARNIGLPGEHVPIEVGKVHQTLGTVYLTTMFLWMMYRAKQDGLVLLVSSLSVCLSVCPSLSLSLSCVCLFCTPSIFVTRLHLLLPCGRISRGWKYRGKVTRGFYSYWLVWFCFVNGYCT